MTRTFVVGAWLCAIVSMVAGACSSSRGTGTNTNWVACSTNANCPANQECIHQRCVAKTATYSLPDVSDGGTGGDATASNGTGGSLGAGGRTATGDASNGGTGGSLGAGGRTATSDASNGGTGGSLGAGGRTATSDASNAAGGGSGVGGCVVSCDVPCNDAGCVPSCHPVVELDRSTSLPLSECKIVVDGSHVYWSLGEDVRRVAKAGGPGTLLAVSHQIRGLAVDGTDMYWTTYGYGTVMRMAKDGSSAAKTFAQGGIPEHMVMDGSTLYWVDGSLQAMSTTTGGRPSVVGTDVYAHSAVAADATNLYWGTNGLELVRYEKTTRAIVTLVDTTTMQQAGGPPAWIVVDGSTLYFSSLRSESSISKVNAAGGPVATVAAGTSPYFAVDADSIYFATAPPAPPEVRRTSKTCGAAVSLTTVTPPTGLGAGCMAADDAYVYWVHVNTLMQYAK